MISIVLNYHNGIAFKYTELRDAIHNKGYLDTCIDVDIKVIQRMRNDVIDPIRSIINHVDEHSIIDMVYESSHDKWLRLFGNV